MKTPSERDRERARECYQALWVSNGTRSESDVIEGIARAIGLAVAEEREACARVADRLAQKWWDAFPKDGGVCCNCGDSASETADQIRARSSLDESPGVSRG